jgi:succinoglycan biosynthesis transport protein ExoP
MRNNPGESSAPAKGITLRDFVAVLFRRKWIILSVFFITAAVTAISVLGKPTVYESTGKLLVKRGVRDNLYGGYVRTLSWAEDLASEVETARSEAVLARAQKMLDDKRRSEGRPRYVIDPVGVEAVVQGESNVIGISYRDRTPAVCVEVTDILLAAYMGYRREAYAVPYPAEFFEGELQKSQSELDRLMEQRKQLLTQSQLTDGTYDLHQMLSVNSSERLAVDEIEREVTKQRSQIEQMRVFAADPLHSTDIPFAAQDGAGLEGVIPGIKNQLVVAQIKYSELSAIYKPDMPEMQQVKSQVDALRIMLDREVQSRIRVGEMQLKSREAELAIARQRYGELKGRLDAFPVHDEQLTGLDRRISNLKESVADMTKRAMEARVTQATSPLWTVLLLSPAGRAYPKNTKDYVRIALAPVFSLIVGLGLAFFVDSLDTSVKTPRQAEELLELPVLATLREQRRR